MPIDIHWEEHCVRATFRGAVNPLEIVGTYRRIEADPRYDLLLESIIDLRELTPIEVGDAILEEMAAENWAASGHNRRLATAVVAEHPAIVDAVRRYKSLMPKPRFAPEVLLCSSLDEARRALRAAAGRQGP